MRSRWIDFGLVVLVVFLEFKGYFPSGPYHAAVSLVKHYIWPSVSEGPSAVSIPHPKVIIEEPPVQQQKAKKMSAVKQIIQDFVTTNKIAIFSKSYCPYCKKAKGLFTQLGWEFAALEMDQHVQGTEIQAELLSMTGQRTVPNIFINGKHVGGCDRVHELHEQDKLKTLL